LLAVAGVVNLARFAVFCRSNSGDVMARWLAARYHTFLRPMSDLVSLIFNVTGGDL
jgi:hypothetical protein